MVVWAKRLTGIVFGLVALLLIEAMRLAAAAARRLPGPRWIAAGAGGAVVAGLAAVTSNRYLGLGLMVSLAGRRHECADRERHHGHRALRAGRRPLLDCWPSQRLRKPAPRHREERSPRGVLFRADTVSPVRRLVAREIRRTTDTAQPTARYRAAISRSTLGISIAERSGCEVDNTWTVVGVASVESSRMSTRCVRSCAACSK